MDNRAKQFRQQLVDAENALKRAKAAVDTLERECRHDFTDPEYNPIITEAYTIPGDPPGTMGIDWRGPSYAPRSEKARWTRECKVCGKVEHTERTNEKVVQTPKF